MGLFYAGILIGPATAPAIAGILTEYVIPSGSGWRAMQYLLFAMGAVGSLLVAFLLPETSHRRGVDLIRQQRQQALDDRTEEEVKRDEAKVETWWEARTKDWIVIFLNPLAPLRILVNPHILAMSLNSSFVLMSTYTILVPVGLPLSRDYPVASIDNYLI